MNNKEFVNLLVRDIKEMSLLCEALPKMDSIPTSLLLLSKEKVESMSSIIDQLLEKAPAAEDSAFVSDEKEEEELVQTETEFSGGEDVVEDIAEATQTITDLFGKVGEEFGKSVKVFVDSIEQAVESAKIEEASCEEDEASEGPGMEDEPSVENGSEKASAESHETKETTVERLVAKGKLTSASAPDRRFVKSLKLCIGDRFRYKKELFGDDMNLLNQTMQELDQLNSLQEAFEYIERFGWSEDNPAVEDFIQLLQSRFS